MLLAAASLMAQGLCPTRQAALEKDINKMMDSLGVVGISIAVVQDNQIVYNNSFGVKDLETREPVTNDTQFRIASISKSFSATAMMQLLTAGKVTLETDVNDILDFKVRNPKFPDVPITVGMLLSHTSSINDNEGYYINLDCINPDKNPNWANAYNDYKPGTGYEYCNLNFSLTGSIIEKLSGERFDQYMEKHIIGPLNLDGSFFLNNLDKNRLAKLYSWNGSEFVNETGAYRAVSDSLLQNYRLGVDPVTFSPAGGMKISAHSLAKYMLMHMNYGKSPLATECVLTDNASKLMQVEHTNGHHYGLALEQTDEYTPGTILVGHTGGAYGLRSAMFFDPVAKYGYVVICNGYKRGEILKTSVSLLHRHFTAPECGKCNDKK